MFPCMVRSAKNELACCFLNIDVLRNLNDRSMFFFYLFVVKMKMGAIFGERIN